MLIDDDGTVLLGDLGVAVSLSEDPTSSHSTAMMSPSANGGYYYSAATAAVSKFPESMQATASRPASAVPTLGRRRSFVGTPCWMAPEVISQKSSSSGVSGYNASADIYSLGITAIELAHGRAPHSLDPPYKALLKTLQNASPTLDRGKGHGKGFAGKGGGYKYSKELKDIVDACLQKDPVKRPTAHELLEMPFFKNAKKKDYLVDVLLKGLPPLTMRQERRVVATAHGSTMQSIRSSWDFNATFMFPPSPTSAHSQLHPHNRDRSNDPKSSHMAVVLPSQAVFPMDKGEELSEEQVEASSEEETADLAPWNDNLAQGVYPSPCGTPPDDVVSPVQKAAMKEKFGASATPLPVPTRKKAGHPTSNQLTPPESVYLTALDTSSASAGDKAKWTLGGTLGRTSSRLLGADDILGPLRALI